VEDGAWYKFGVSSKRTERSACWLPVDGDSRAEGYLVPYSVVFDNTVWWGWVGAVPVLGVPYPFPGFALSLQCDVGRRQRKPCSLRAWSQISRVWRLSATTADLMLALGTS